MEEKKFRIGETVKILTESFVENTYGIVVWAQPDLRRYEVSIRFNKGLERVYWFEPHELSKDNGS